MREWLREARVGKNLTQSQAAELLGVSESYYSMIENGKRQKTLDLTMAERISKVFGISIGKIVRREV